MKIDPALREHLTKALAPLENQPHVYPFPAAASLTRLLGSKISRNSKGAFNRNVDPAVAQMFATASINMWMRGVHSFLISASLTGVSPIWASVAGYYSSHYSIRALAHLLGSFRLFTNRRLVHLHLEAGRYVCNFEPKNGREHEIYWLIVKDDPHFISDPFFTQGNPEVSHRDWAQYIDHLPQLPPFRPLDKHALRLRIDRISEIPFDTPPIPQASDYPNVDAVQIIAYHRLVRFRRFVDTILGIENSFWNVNRTPPWTIEFMDFQLVEGESLHKDFVSS
jgi:hypothetical protein